MMMSAVFRGSVALTFVLTVHAVDHRDLQWAKTKVPRSAWKGDSFSNMSGVLNGHLQKMFPKTKPCHEWTVESLQQYQAKLHAFRHGDLNKIYSGSADRRRLQQPSIEAYEQRWERHNRLASQHAHLKEHGFWDSRDDGWHDHEWQEWDWHQDMHRDGHCHEAVMWLVHHIPSADQHSIFARMEVPMLSHARHSCNASSGSPGEAELCKSYEGQVSCAECHSGTGIPMQDYSDVEGRVPEDPAHPGWAIQRRCDQNYKPACGPCDGVGGPYWGDEVAKFQPTNCEVVALPTDVPPPERTSPQFAESFTAHQLGSDRLARTQNAAPHALYSQIRSTLFYDFPLGGESEGTAPEGMARLRHDTFYDDLPYRLLDNGLVTEIHLQTAAQRAANVTGPMVSLVHALLGLGKYSGGCTCLADPVGVPTLGGTVDVLKAPHAAFLEGADYLGRVKIGVEYDGFKLGDAGHGDMTKKRNMTVDHYIKWFLHLFVDADKSSPTYNQPVRFYGPYSGFAVYVGLNKSAPHAEVWDTACVENGWGTKEGKDCVGKKITEHYPCMNVEKKHPEVCKPYEGPGAEGATAAAADSLFHGAFGSFPVPQHPVQYI